MPEARYSLASPSETSYATSDIDTSNSVRYVHTLPQAGRVLPSASRWNSIELDFNLIPPSSNSAYDSFPTPYSKSFNYDLIVTDRRHFRRFVIISVSLVFIILAIGLVLHFLPHKQNHSETSQNYTLAINKALTFFDAQKSGKYPKNSPVKFRGDSGLRDGITNHSLEGGFYDSGNNIKFSFPTAYTVTLLSWSVIEYHDKFADVGELDHVKDIIRWGSDYLLRLFDLGTEKSDSILLFSQVGSANESSQVDNDMKCWQRPEDMTYARPVSTCRGGEASDIAGEIVAALSAASLVFKQDNKTYSGELQKAAQNLFELVKNEDQGSAYTTVDACGGEARAFYKSSGYRDELVWAGTWLFFATGNASHLGYVNDHFISAKMEQLNSEEGLFYWNNKLTANAVLLTRLRFFSDPGYPYETALTQSSSMTDSLMCSYLSHGISKTPGGLVLLRAGNGAQLQFAATAAFLSKVYSDYLNLLHKSGGSCNSNAFSLNMLHSFSSSQIDYILGANPTKMSYLVGFGDKYPTQVHHRSASIPWDGKHYSCAEGENLWRNSDSPNPNILMGAMVAGPDEHDNFKDERGKSEFTEPTISSNAGLVAALVALQDPPRHSSYENGANLGIDKKGMFENVKFTPSSP